MSEPQDTNDEAWGAVPVDSSHVTEGSADLGHVLGLPAEHTVKIERAIRADGTPSDNHGLATCTCGWRGVLHPTRTVEGFDLAERDATRHLAEVSA